MSKKENFQIVDNKDIAALHKSLDTALAAVADVRGRLFALQGEAEPKKARKPRTPKTEPTGDFDNAPVKTEAAAVVAAAPAVAAAVVKRSAPAKTAAAPKFDKAAVAAKPAALKSPVAKTKANGSFAPAMPGRA